MIGVRVWSQEWHKLALASKFQCCLAKYWTNRASTGQNFALFPLFASSPLVALQSMWLLNWKIDYWNVFKQWFKRTVWKYLWQVCMPIRPSWFDHLCSQRAMRWNSNRAFLPALWESFATRSLESRWSRAWRIVLCLLVCLWTFSTREQRYFKNYFRKEIFFALNHLLDCDIFLWKCWFFPIDCWMNRETFWTWSLLQQASYLFPLIFFFFSIQIKY